MQRRPRSLVVSVVLTFAAIGGVVGGASAAAAPWSEPKLVSGSFGQIRFDPDGHGSLIGIGQARVLAAPVEDGTPGKPRESTTPLTMIQLRVYGRDGVVVGGSLSSGFPTHVALARGRFGLPLGRPQPLGGRSQSSHLLGLAVNEAGDAVAAVRWCLNARCGRQTLEVVRWRAGAQLSKPLRIARGGVLGAGVAINARGDVAILWDRRGSRGSRREVVGQILTASGRLRPARRLGSALTSPRYRIEMTSGRQVVAAWVAQNVNECYAHPGEIAVVQAASGGRFARARRLVALDVTGCGRDLSGPGVDFARLPNGRVLIAWSGNEGTRWVVRAGELGAAGVQGPAVISDRASDAVLADLAVGTRGEAIVLLADGVGGADPSGPPRLLAVTRGAVAGGFAAPELVADKAGQGSSVAFDPATGRAIVAYYVLGDQSSPVTSLVTRDPIAP